MRNGTRNELLRNQAGAMGFSLAAELEKLETRVLFSTTPLVAAPLVTVNHAPTELKTGKLAQAASQTYGLSITRGELIRRVGAADADGDAIQFLVTQVSTGKGQLTITHNGTTSAVVVGSTLMKGSDTLTWTPSGGTTGVVKAFTVRAFDGQALAKNAAAVQITTRALPLVTIATDVTNAWETQPSTHPGTIKITRASATKLPLVVTLALSGTAMTGTHFTLVGPTGNIAINNGIALVTIPAKSKTAILKVEAVQDGVADPTLKLQVALAMDPAAKPLYKRSEVAATEIAKINILDSSPTVTIAANSAGIEEGSTNATAFTLTRTAAPGGTLVGGDTKVEVDFSGTFGASAHGFSPVQTIDFGVGGATTELVTISSTDDGLAGGAQTIIASITPGTSPGFTPFIIGTAPTTVNVIDAQPTVTITANSAGIVEGQANATAFTLTRTAAPGHSLVGVDSVAVVTFSGTFAASNHGFSTTQTIDFGTAGATSMNVLVSSTANATADGTKTLIGTITSATGPGFSPFNVVTAAATTNVADSLPTVSIAANSAGIVEGSTDATVFTLTRTAPAGTSLVGVDTKVNVAFTGTFAASGHGFASSQVIDFGNAGATTMVVTVTSADNGAGNGTQTIIGTISAGSGPGTTPFNLGTATATTNVTDASPVVNLTTQVATASATSSTATPGLVVLTRSGEVATNLNVVLTPSTGTGFGVEGTDFNLFANGQKVVNDTVTIGVGHSTVAVTVVPLDNHINDSLKTTLTLAKGGWNNGTSSTATVTLTNFDRPPLIGQTKVLRLANRGGSLTFTFDALVSLVKAGLAADEKGTLQLTLSTLPIGTAQVIKAGTTTLTSLAAGGTLSEGDTLIWTAPANTKESVAAAFTIGATDGTVKSATTCEFDVTII